MTTAATNIREGPVFRSIPLPMFGWKKWRPKLGLNKKSGCHSDECLDGGSGGGGSRVFSVRELMVAVVVGRTEGRGAAGRSRSVGWRTGDDDGGTQLLSDAMRVETKIVNDDNESLRPLVLREGGRIFHSSLDNAEELGITF